MPEENFDKEAIRQKLSRYPKEVLVEFLIQNAWVFPYNGGKQVEGSVQDLAWEMEITELKRKREDILKDLENLKTSRLPQSVKIKRMLDLHEAFDKNLARIDQIMGWRYPSSEIQQGGSRL